MDATKTLLARLVALVAPGNAEVRELWLDAYPDDATDDEKANRAKNDKLRAEEAAKAADAAKAANQPK